MLAVFAQRTCGFSAARTQHEINRLFADVRAGIAKRMKKSGQYK